MNDLLLRVVSSTSFAGSNTHLCLCFHSQRVSRKILPEQESLLSFLPGQTVTVVLELTLPPAQHTHTHTHTHVNISHIRIKPVLFILSRTADSASSASARWSDWLTCCTTPRLWLRLPRPRTCSGRLRRRPSPTARSASWPGRSAWRGAWPPVGEETRWFKAKADDWLVCGFWSVSTDVPGTCLSCPRSSSAGRRHRGGRWCRCGGRCPCPPSWPSPGSYCPDPTGSDRRTRRTS